MSDQPQPPETCPMCKAVFETDFGPSTQKGYACGTVCWLWRDVELRFDISSECKARQLSALQGELRSARAKPAAMFEALRILATQGAEGPASYTPFTLWKDGEKHA